MAVVTQLLPPRLQKNKLELDSVRKTMISGDIAANGSRDGMRFRVMPLVRSGEILVARSHESLE